MTGERADGPTSASIQPRVFTIPAHRAFSDALVAGLLARTRGDPLGLSRALILLPNNRAIRAVQDAFVRRATNGLILPRLVAIGDPDLDEAIGAALDPIEGDDPIPPAIDPMARRMILARLIEEERARVRDPVDGVEAVRLAADVARTIDQLAVEKKSVDDLLALDRSGELAVHWQRAYATFAVVATRWPAELERLGRIDLSDRRDQLLAAAERRWRAAPPDGPVIAAGIATPAPAVAALLGRIAALEQGMVVFPALDLAVPEEEWQALGPHASDPATGARQRSIETHPQFALKLLLQRMGVARGEVALWRGGGCAAASPARSRAIGNAMAPAEYSHKWQALKPADRRLTGVRALELATPAEEAQAIAIAIREALETPARTVALVTPDRGLARRVSAHLQRWGIAADDSAGRPLSATPPGAFLVMLARAAAERWAPVPLLALLKHPLVKAGAGRAAWLAEVRRLDAALRGPRPPAGLDGVLGYLGETADWFGGVAGMLRPLDEAYVRHEPPTTLIARLREAADALCGEALWAGPDGRAAAELFETIERELPAGPRGLAPETIAPLLERLMGEIAVRPPQGGHPRVAIWGLIEAQLQHADLVIMGGLNEGMWPAPPAPDPWLGPGIRAALGLSGLERRIGLAAHGFASLLGSPRVLVTRARRDARAPAIASRFWLRLEAMTGGMTREPRIGRWAKLLDWAADFKPAERPKPRPPLAARPKTIHVTKLDRLQADPFAFYADAILRLKSWDAVDAEPSAAWRGSEVHAVLEAWWNEDRCDPAKLRARAEALLARADTHPVVRALWTPRLIEAIEWIAQQTADDLAAGRRPIAAELSGEAEAGGVTLKGRVDRIDRAADGSLAIVDYKTGQPPSSKAVANGYAMQLGLLGLIAERGGFEGVAGVAGAFEYWSLASKAGALGFVQSPVLGRSALIAPEDFTRNAEAKLRDAAAKWLLGEEPFIAKLHPEYAPYADYDQLMRLDEWYGRQGDAA